MSLFHFFPYLPNQPSLPGGQKAKKKWVRKAPLVSAGLHPQDANLHPDSMKNRHLILSKREGNELFSDMKTKLLKFLTTVHTDNW